MSLWFQLFNWSWRGKYRFTGKQTEAGEVDQHGWDHVDGEWRTLEWTQAVPDFAGTQFQVDLLVPPRSRGPSVLPLPVVGLRNYFLKPLYLSQIFIDDCSAPEAG